MDLCPKCGIAIRVDCGSCGGFHLGTYHGDCRDDAQRYPTECNCELDPSHEPDKRYFREPGYEKIPPKNNTPGLFPIKAKAATAGLPMPLIQPDFESKE